LLATANTGALQGPVVVVKHLAHYYKTADPAPTESQGLRSARCA